MAPGYVSYVIHDAALIVIIHINGLYKVVKANRQDFHIYGRNFYYWAF